MVIGEYRWRCFRRPSSDTCGFVETHYDTTGGQHRTKTHYDTGLVLKETPIITKTQNQKNFFLEKKVETRKNFFGIFFSGGFGEPV